MERETFFCYLSSVALNLEMAAGYYSNFRFWFKGVCHASRVCSLFLRVEDFFPVMSTYSAWVLLTFLQHIKRCWRQYRTRHHFSTSPMKALLCLSPYLGLSPFWETIKYFRGHGQCCSQEGVAVGVYIPNPASSKCCCRDSGMRVTLLILDLAWPLLLLFYGICQNLSWLSNLNICKMWLHKFVLEILEREPDCAYGMYCTVFAWKILI